MNQTDYRKKRMFQLKQTIPTKIPFIVKTEGDNILRVLPPIPERLASYADPDFFIFTRVHNNIRGQKMYCNRMIGMPCFCCKTHERMMNSDKPGAAKSAEKYAAHDSYAAAAFSLKTQSTGVLAFGKQHYNKLIDWFVGTMYGDFTDLGEGGRYINWVQKGTKTETRYYPEIDKDASAFELREDEIDWIDLSKVPIFIHPDDQRDWMLGKYKDPETGEDVQYDKLFDKEHFPRIISFNAVITKFFGGRIPSETEAEKLFASKGIKDLWAAIGDGESGDVFVKGADADEPESDFDDGEEAINAAAEVINESLNEKPAEKPAPEKPKAEADDEFDFGDGGNADKADDLPPVEESSKTEPKPEPKKADPPKKTGFVRKPVADEKKPDPVVEQIMADKKKWDSYVDDDERCFGKAYDQTDKMCNECKEMAKCQKYFDGVVKVDATKKTESDIEKEMMDALK